MKKKIKRISIFLKSYVASSQSCVDRKYVVLKAYDVWNCVVSFVLPCYMTYKVVSTNILLTLCP